MLSTFATHSYYLSSSLLLRTFLIELHLQTDEQQTGKWPVAPPSPLHPHPPFSSEALKSNFKCQCKMLLTHNWRNIYNTQHPPSPSAPFPAPASPAGAFRRRLNNFVEDFIELNQFRMHVNAAAAQSTPRPALCFLLPLMMLHKIQST